VTAVDSRGNDEAGEEGGVKLPADIEAASNREEDHEAPTGHAEAFDEANPNPPKEGTPVHHAPIAIFSQPIRRASRSYKYIGWYKIVRLQIIEPESEELVYMLMKKWETKDRYGRIVSRQQDVSKWKESMSYRWAVVKMEKDELTMQEKGEPKIERLEEDEILSGGGGSGCSKSVNEMLAEMRLKG
jgi:hypothetical protein